MVLKMGTSVVVCGSGNSRGGASNFSEKLRFLLLGSGSLTHTSFLRITIMAFTEFHQTCLENTGQAFGATLMLVKLRRTNGC